MLVLEDARPAVVGVADNCAIVDVVAPRAVADVDVVVVAVVAVVIAAIVNALVVPTAVADVDVVVVVTAAVVDAFVVAVAGGFAAVQVSLEQPH
jgi:hypothetical protein